MAGALTVRSVRPVRHGPVFYLSDLKVGQRRRAGRFPRGGGTRLFYPQVRAWWAAAPDSPAGAAESRGELRPGPKHQEDEKKYPVAISPSLATGLQKPNFAPCSWESQRSGE